LRPAKPVREILERQTYFPDEIHNYRRQYLTAEEIANIQREKEGPL
jgi:hypothetical protein